MGLKEQTLQWVLGVSKHGDSWWMPFLLLTVAVGNSITAGAFVAVLGVLQATLYTIIVMSRKYTFVIGPICLSIGAMAAAYTYTQIIKASGADVLLDRTGLKESYWLDRARQWAESYGNLGIIFLSLTPSPTVVVVVSAMLAKMDEYTVMTLLFVTRFIHMMVGAAVLKYVTQGMTPEEYIRREFLGEKPGTFIMEFELGDGTGDHLGLECVPVEKKGLLGDDSLEIKSISKDGAVTKWNKDAKDDTMSVQVGDSIVEINGKPIDPKKSLKEQLIEHSKDPKRSPKEQEVQSLRISKVAAKKDN